MTISEAKFRLYNKSPFFGSIIFNLPIVEDKTISTMGVDGERLYYNPAFWDKLKPKEQLGLLCHEVGHLFLGHLWRQKNRLDMAVNPKTGETVYLFNIAGDIILNNMILKDPKFSLTRGCLKDPKYEGWSTEQVYEDLKKNMKKMTPQQIEALTQSSVCDKSKWGKGNKKKSKQLEAKWKNIAKQAYNHAKQKGDVPAGMERMFKELEPKENWRQILLQYVQPFWNDYSFNPVDRRFLDEDFILPDIKSGEKIDWLAIAIDTSGSISSVELNAFISEVKGILECYDQVKIKLTFCDAEAEPFIELDEFDVKKIKPTGGGGTDFRPVFKLVAKEDSEPLALLYFTDTQGDFPDKHPNYDVIWVAISNWGQMKVPWGKLLPYRV